MKYNLLFLPVITFLLFSCNEGKRSGDNRARQVPSICTDSTAVNYEKGVGDTVNCVYIRKDKKPLLVYFTSTECPTCGKKGNAVFNRFIRNYADSIVPMAVHYGFGDPLQVNKSDALFNIFFPTHSPYFFLNRQPVMNKNRRVFSSDTVQENMRRTYREISSEAALAASAAWLEINSDLEARIFFGARFFRDTVGLYSLAVYLVEDSVRNDQAGIDTGHTYHRNVLRHYITSPVGTAITTGVVKKGYQYRSNKNFKLYDEWNTDHLRVISVIWEKTGKGARDWQVVNASASGVKFR